MAIGGPPNPMVVLTVDRLDVLVLVALNAMAKVFGDELAPSAVGKRYSI